MRIAFLVRALSVGGAERQLTLLATGLAERGHQVEVMVFYRGGPLEADLESAGVSIVDLEKSGRWDVVGFVFRLWKYLRASRPDIVYSFLPSANVLIAIAGYVLPSLRLAWGVRSTEMSYDKRDWLGKLAASVESGLARRAAAVICNSFAARAVQIRRGVKPERLIVIRNILDSDRYQRTEAGRLSQRASWNLSEAQVAVGIVGRLDPMKGHRVFLDAVSRLVKCRTDIRVFIVGDGPDAFRAQLQAAARRHIGPGIISWLPSQNDLTPIYSALDVVCSASFSEGFSNVLCEAMACGCTCVATDVGDSGDILAGFGKLVPPGNAIGLAEALDAAVDGLASADVPGMRHHILALCGRDAVLNVTETVLTRGAAGLPLASVVSNPNDFGAA